MGVPAKQVGWISRHGIPLPEPDADGIMICPESGYYYKEVDLGVVKCVDLDEEASLPPEKAIGVVLYRDLKMK